MHTGNGNAQRLVGSQKQTPRCGQRESLSHPLLVGQQRVPLAAGRPRRINLRRGAHIVAGTQLPSIASVRRLGLAGIVRWLRVAAST